MTQLWHVYTADLKTKLGTVKAPTQYGALVRAAKQMFQTPESIVVRLTPLPGVGAAPYSDDVADEAGGDYADEPERKQPTGKQREKLIDKIKKLLALTKSPNEHEAARAAERAQAMLAEYNLALEDVLKEDKPEGTVIDKSVVTPSNPWRRRLGTALATLYFCEYFFVPDNAKSTNRHCFVGTEANVTVARLMFEYLIKTVDRLAREGALSYPQKERSPYRTTFREACSLRLAARIHDRIEKAKEGGIKTEAGTKLPALLNLYEQAQQRNREALEKLGIQLENVKTKTYLEHFGGYRDGDKAGRNISLEQQVEADKRKRIADRVDGYDRDDLGESPDC